MIDEKPNGLYLVLPFPPSSLNPNVHKHWAAKNRDRVDMREASYYIALEKGVKLDPEKRYDVTLTFCPPDRRERDEDNLVASMKSAMDGMCRALGIDDSHIHIIPEMGPVVHLGKVEIQIVESRPRPMVAVGVDLDSGADQGVLAKMEKDGDLYRITEIHVLTMPQDACLHRFDVQDDRYEYCSLCGSCRKKIGT